MPYLSLARKYRPQTFKEVIGQDAVTIALENSIKLKKEPHAIIFTGVRGIGKTSLARIYAKALNCDHGPTPSPCCICQSCIAIAKGIHEDILEIDGASNTSVDDIRELRETINYSPQRSKFRIYIIDEVHMLSQSAFNALLKTLEEPPPHVVFIFATTEIQKIPYTVISRCHVFYLKKISANLIKEQLQHILSKENIEYEEGAVSLIAKEAQGSMRDALTLTDHAIALGEGKLKLQNLTNIISSLSINHLKDLLLAIINKNAQLIIDQIHTANELGIDFTTVVEDLAKLVRDSIIYKSYNNQDNIIKVLLNNYDLEVIESIASKTSTLELNRIFRILIKCRSDLLGNELDRYIFENYLLEWCADPGISTIYVSQNREQHQFHNSHQNSQSQPISTVTTTKLTADTKTLKEKLNLPNENTKTQQTEFNKQNIVNPKTSNIDTNTTEKSSFPDSWYDLVQRWKQQKPLQARLLEEVNLIEFSTSKITLAVDPQSIVGSKLLQADIRSKLAAEFKNLFNFNGELLILNKDLIKNSNTQHQESILTIKEKERQTQIAQEKQSIAQNPFLLNALDVFNLNINNVKIKSKLEEETSL